ncbi:unnamed protein product [Prorocentrum cordatum]|uniref:Uncharacterized protein n=1 Tax=Prorocentrum cordatum TaxID=2364126 RepID=A0ABN9QUI6_9DINO|nr:unnamed protein product [Polarella glacialis]
MLLLAREDPEALAAVPGLVLVCPQLDLTCGSPTYTSSQFSRELLTGDVLAPLEVHANRELRKGRCRIYTGSEELLRDCVLSPYWLCRGRDEALLRAVERAGVPVWICTGAAETLQGEILDFAQRLRDRLPLEVAGPPGDVPLLGDAPVPGLAAVPQQGRGAPTHGGVPGAAVVGGAAHGG